MGQLLEEKVGQRKDVFEKECLKGKWEEPNREGEVEITGEKGS